MTLWQFCFNILLLSHLASHGNAHKWHDDCVFMSPTLQCSINSTITFRSQHLLNWFGGGGGCGKGNQSSLPLEFNPIQTGLFWYLTIGSWRLKVWQILRNLIRMVTAVSAGTFHPPVWIGLMVCSIFRKIPAIHGLLEIYQEIFWYDVIFRQTWCLYHNHILIGTLSQNLDSEFLQFL